MPRAPKKCATATCEERVRGVKYCPAHKPEAWQGSTRRHANSSSEDIALANRVKAEEPTCRDCGAPTTVAGHIIPHAYGGLYVRSNLKGQCTKCNNEQIHTDRAKYVG